MGQFTNPTDAAAEVSGVSVDEEVVENKVDDEVCEEDEENSSLKCEASLISLLVWVIKIFLIVFSSVN